MAGPDGQAPPPLQGFRVLDLTRFLAGPYCTMVLADLGADVIKVEQPGSGDDSRLFGPFSHGESYSFAQVNRGKRSVCLDLRRPRGRELACDLAERSDLVIESFRPGVAARLGLDYAAVSRRRPDVLYCSISGFGQTGPYRDRPGFDIMAQGITGLMRMTGEPGGRPAKVGFAVNDIAAGVTAVYSILAAQLVRERTGAGQSIDISLVDAQLAWTVWEAGVLFGRGEAPAQTGTRHRLSAPYQAYRTADGYLTIGAGTDRLWRRTADALGSPHWCDDPRFADNDARLANIDALEASIEAVTTTRGTAEWIEVLDAAGVPCGPVLTYDQALADPHVQAREMIAEMDHPIMGTVRTLGQPAKFSRSRSRPGRPAPWLGQHSREVLAWLGLAPGEIDELEREGTTYDAHPGTA